MQIKFKLLYMKRIVFVLLMLITQSKILLAQEWQKSVSYTITNKTVYQLENNVNTSEIPSEDLIMLSPSEKTEHHNEYYSENYGYIHETTIVSDSDYPKWMEVPAKRIITSDGITLYNISGGVISNHVYDSVFMYEDYLYMLDIASNEGPFPTFNFSKFTEAYLDELRQSGYLVSGVESGLISISKNEMTSIIDIENLSVTLMNFNENGIEKYRTERTFYRDQYGKLYPKEKIEIKHEVTHGNIPFKRIDYTVYSNYIRGGSDTQYNIPINELLATKNTTYASQIVVFPNPSSNLLNIVLPQANSDDTKNVEVNVKDLNGNILISKNIESGNTITYDISHLSIGSYLVDITWRGHKKLIHFIKL